MSYKGITEIYATIKRLSANLRTLETIKNMERLPTPGVVIPNREVQKEKAKAYLYKVKSIIGAYKKQGLIDESEKRKIYEIIDTMVKEVENDNYMAAFNMIDLLESEVYGIAIKVSMPFRR